ncbi:hydrolase [Varibaculum cambriense]|uniref:Hydrolase n=2 Tax=Varibaculum cambriense TaxID=184870 RepID=A0ABX4UV62_9ACTO|nr:hydrolase [Varibaculum cambriense]
MLKKMLGEEAAEDAFQQLQASGIDPEKLAGGAMPFPFPGGSGFGASQLKQFFTPRKEAVNWDAAVEVAASRLPSFAPTSAAQAQKIREQLSVADLWLDTVTTLSPTASERVAWTPREWIQATVPAWQRLTEPVIANVVRAFTEAIAEQFERQGIDPEEMKASAAIPGIGQIIGPMDPDSLLKNLAAGLFAVQIGQAMGQIAQVAFGSTDIGIPLAKEKIMGLVPVNIANFAQDLEITEEEIGQYLAVREAAHARLFHSVPWLRHKLSRLIARYAQEIRIDPEAIDRSVRDLQDRLQEQFGEQEGLVGLPLGNFDPANLGLGLPVDIFASEETATQRQAMEDLQTVLALIEGWVDEVSTRACMPNLAHVIQLRELLRRRRATTSPIEKVLKPLIGMELRPKYSRQAASLWSLLLNEQGMQQRDQVWSHPDMIPTLQDLTDPENFVARSGKEPEKDQVDQDLDSLLSGTLGWAQGLTPEVDSQGDQLVGGNQEAETEPDGASKDQNGEDASHRDNEGENDSPSADTDK